MNHDSGRLEFHFTRPAGVWAATAVALSGIGWFKGISLMLLLGYFLLALIGVNFLVARRTVRAVTGRLRDTRPAFAGERVIIAAEVENPGPQTAPVMIVVPLQPHPVRWLLAPFSPGQRDVLRTEATFPNRGRHPVGSLTVESGYPFGLIVWSHTLPYAPSQGLAVLPRAGRISVDGLRKFMARAATGEGRTRRPARRPTPGSGDLRGVRPYRPGDSPRDVHWKTTARRNQLIVREYDQTDPLNLVLVVDPWLPAEPSVEASERLEWALSVTASIGVAWAGADEPGDLTLVLPGPPATAIRCLALNGFDREAFAPLADLVGRPDVPAVPANLVRPTATRTARLVVSSRPDSPLLVGLRRAGVPAAGVDPTSPPRWYLPPDAVDG